MTDIQAYGGPFVVNDVVSYFLKDGVWYYRNAFIPINLECKQPPPAEIVKEWMDKYGSAAPKSTKQAKQKVATPLKKSTHKPKLSSADKDSEMLKRKRKHEQMLSNSSTSSSTTSKPLPVPAQKVVSSSALPTPGAPSPNIHKQKQPAKPSSAPTPKTALSSNAVNETPTKISATQKTQPPKVSTTVTDEALPATEVAPAPLVMITTSEPLIQEAKEKFQRTAPHLYQQLIDRMEIRKMIMEPSEEDSVSTAQKDRLKPYCAPTNSRADELLDSQRENEHERHSVASHEFMTHLLNADEVEAKLKIRNVLQKDTFRPIPSRMDGAGGITVPVEHLASFMEENDVAILNVDRFITATDNRTLLYNADGNCVFCTVHRVPSPGTHRTAAHCPYTFCACVQCFVAEKCPLLRG
ncbi:hypothetical protein niasHT_037021 [Heterodera trifolii]|uniref:Uncharacterized protein n=1 Tax=Heterodera trifolii TaxID=157864 RepID=A0ABD2IRR5_9BILA